MKEVLYIMALENYAEDNALHHERQKEANYTGIEEIYMDLINYENRETLEFNKMLDEINVGDVVKISKITVLGPNITNIVSKYKMLQDKKVKLFISGLGIITDNAINSDKCIDTLQSIENDRLYYNRCIGLLKSIKNRPEHDNNPPGMPKKYSNKQLKEALSLSGKFTYKEISNMTGISESTLYRASRKFVEK